MTSKILLAIVGPTGIGKTEKAIVLAQHFGTEIISADSRQFYKEMTIGTAVPSLEELATVKHHFIQHLSVVDPYTVGDYEKDALQLLSTLFKRHAVVVLVGGSGLFVDALTRGLDHFPEVPQSLKTELQQLFEQQGLGILQERLLALDPDYYQRVDRENPQRLLRALGVCIASGQPYSSFLGKPKILRDFTTITIGIEATRDLIYDRINQRVDGMIANGLLTEAKSLYKHSALNALQTVGYRELFAHFDGKCSYEEAISEIKKNTRRYAKRQLTWYRKKEHLTWLPRTISDDALKQRVASLLGS
ncbi:MAG: tRNA (adenosine(37)-N6)-dimethylallyltransferase MiaA [Bacteroidota bacterium]